MKNTFGHVAETMARPARDVMANFLEPSSIAVIGASTDSSKASGRPTSLLRDYGFAGEVYPINPSHAEVHGFPAFSDVREVPSTPDLAVICLSAEHVAEAIAQCGEKGIESAVIFANGFVETGNIDGQRSVSAAAARFGVRILGPNCLGAANPRNGVCATFSSFIQKRGLRAGSTALLTQSGAIGNACLLAFDRLNVGLSCWVATGNESDLTILDFADYLVDDPHSSSIVCFVESHRDGERWVEIARRAQDLGKPIVVLKGGSSDRSHSLASSHSGKMLGSYEAWREFADYLGILAPETLSELSDLVHLLDVTHRTGVVPSSDGLGIVCSSGGLGVLLADQCQRHGVSLTDLAPSTALRLQRALPAAAGVTNPIDPTPVSDETYLEAAKILLDDPGVKTVLVIVNSLSRDYIDLPGRLVRLSGVAREAGKCLAVSYFSEADSFSVQTEAELRSAGVVVLPDPARIIRCQGVVGRSLAGSSRPTSKIPDSRDLLSPQGADWNRIASELTAIGIPVIRAQVLGSKYDAMEFIRGATGQVVMKLDDPAILHKSDVGAVVLGIVNPDEGANIYDELWAKRTSERASILGQDQAEPGVEVIVSIRKDPELGPMVSVGAGGTLAELITDISSAPCPITAEEAIALVGRTRISRLLAGYRGSNPSDIEALALVVSQLSTMPLNDLELREVELNPVRVFARGEGCVVLDALALE